MEKCQECYKEEAVRVQTVMFEYYIVVCEGCYVI